MDETQPNRWDYNLKVESAQFKVEQLWVLCRI